MFVSRLNILDLHVRSNQPLNFQNLTLFIMVNLQF